MSLRTLTVTALLFAVPVAGAQTNPTYRDPQAPIAERVADLLSRMTLEEKVAQTVTTWQNRDLVREEEALFVDEQGNFLEERAARILRHGLGQIARPSEKRGPRAMALYTNEVQRWVMQNTRLGIPVVFHEECLHGHAAPQGTSYPQPIALASTWNPELVERIFRATASEVRARGAQQCLTPVLDLAREPRWGRTEETYGEDPYLASRIGVAAIRGLQGRGPGISRQSVIATGKHFAVHGQPEAGTNVAPGNYSERIIREVFLPPFEAAVREAGLRSIMASYNEIDGIPAHASKFYLDQVLRREWGFRGYVVADYFAVEQLRSLHRVAADNAQAARLALEAGVDIELPFPQTYPTLIEAVKKGEIPEAALDQAVTRLLTAKFEIGLFEEPFADPDEAERVTNSPGHRQLALEAARQSIILLKNEGGVLPLERKRVRRIAVVGPNAAGVHLGGYSDDPGRGVSILEGIRKLAGDAITVVYAEGARITESEPNWWADEVAAADPERDAERIREAVSTVRSADVAIVVVGENESTSREAWSETHLGDRDSLELLGRQAEMVRAIHQTGVPTVVVRIGGRPNSMPWIAENVPAILEGWYLGQEGGTAMAEVLFGEHNPAGRLPVTVARNVGQLPVYYNHKPSARRGYLFSSHEPLFPFGHGLSYTTFAYSGLRVVPESIRPEGTATVSVTVTNTGSRAGDEVVQLYLRDEVSSVTRPVKELRGFQRVSLRPGEATTVTFRLGPNDLRFYNVEMKRVVEPGWFEVMVGGSSEPALRGRFEVRE